MHIKFSSITYHNAGNKTGFRLISEIIHARIKSDF